MTQQQTVNLLLWIQTGFAFLIAIRAFFLYTKSRSDELMILGIAMVTIAAASISGLVADNLFARTDNVFGGKFNVLWFEYGGQTISYLFIFLSTLQVSSLTYLSRLRVRQLIITTILIFILLLTPVIPPFPGPVAQALLSNTRSVICFALFLRYVTIFFKKESRFSFLMSGAFLLLAVGILIVTSQFFPSGPILLVYTGYTMRISGLIFLLLAFFAG